MLFAVFPTGVARYLVAFSYVPVLLALSSRFRDASLFSALLIGLILMLFPFLDQFRYFSGFENLRFLPERAFFYAAHFDAYENLASAVESGFISYGGQIVGSLLFFIPRVFWLDKPVGSGYQMAEQLGYSFKNISMPFLGEGFINFGFLGVVVFVSSLGFLFGVLDRRFSKLIWHRTQIDYSLAIYYYLFGGFFFVLRGDLLSSTAYVVAGLFSAFLVRFLCTQR
jgi:hypothetical protein